MESLLCWATTPEHGACLESGYYTSDTPLDKTDFPFTASINCKELFG